MSERPGDTDLYEEQFKEYPEPEGDIEAFKRKREDEEVFNERPLPARSLLD